MNKFLLFSALLISVSGGYAQNIGIGTTNPLAPLHISSGTTEKIRLDGVAPALTFYSSSTSLAILQATGTGFQLGTVSGYNFPTMIYAGGIQAATFLPNGNVGIGITNPAYKLDISGSVNISNSIYLANSQGNAGQVITSSGAGQPPVWAAPPQPPQISFSTYLDINVPVASGTLTSLGPLTEFFDDGNNFNANQFTAPAAGTYYFAGKIQWQSPATGIAALRLRFIKNGATFIGSQSDVIQSSNPSFTISISHSIIVKLLAGETISIDVNQASAGPLNMLGGTSTATTVFSGYRIY